MKIFIDENCRCYVSNPHNTYTEVEAPKHFEGKCVAYIEGFRYRPYGYTYTRDDGYTFGPNGSSVTPWKPYDELVSAQQEYERHLLNEYKESLLELGVEV